MSTRAEQIHILTTQLEQGVKDVFQSEHYQQFLRTMSRFHSYSINNQILIHLQCPEASYVAGYTRWRNEFHRHVKAGEQGIHILAPAPYKRREEVEDPVTHEKTTRQITVMSYRPAICFDYSQTEGEPLPELTQELIRNVPCYEEMLEAIRRIASPVPIEFVDIAGSAYGYYSPGEDRIVVQRGLSQIQTVKTTLHEFSHSLLHNKAAQTDCRKDRQTMEVEAESVAYVVSTALGLSVEEYSFPYIVSWSSGRDIRELKSSLETIRQTSCHIIDQVQTEMRNIRLEHSQQFLVNQELTEHNRHQSQIHL